VSRFAVRNPAKFGKSKSSTALLQIGLRFDHCLHSKRYQMLVICCLAVKEYWTQPARHIVRRYRQRQQQQQAQASYSSSGDDDGLVLTKSLHVCGYPDCGKQFRHKQHLLRHQTQKHGRTPKRILALRRVWMRPGDISSGESFSNTGMDTSILNSLLAETNAGTD